MWLLSVVQQLHQSLSFLSLLVVSWSALSLSSSFLSKSWAVASQLVVSSSLSEHFVSLLSPWGPLALSLTFVSVTTCWWSSLASSVSLLVGLLAGYVVGPLAVHLMHLVPVQNELEHVELASSARRGACRARASACPIGRGTRTRSGDSPSVAVPLVGTLLFAMVRWKPVVTPLLLGRCSVYGLEQRWALVEAPSWAVQKHSRRPHVLAAVAAGPCAWPFVWRTQKPLVVVLPLSGVCWGHEPEQRRPHVVEHELESTAVQLVPPQPVARAGEAVVPSVWPFWPTKCPWECLLCHYVLVPTPWVHRRPAKWTRKCPY